MQDDFSQMMTPFDLSVSSRSLQITKLLLPFLPPKSQRIIAIYIKFIEFQNTLTTFSGICNSSSDPMEEFKKFLPSSTLETYDNIMNMMSMMQYMQEMTDDFDPMSMMADMFDTNQKEGASN